MVEALAKSELKANIPHSFLVILSVDSTWYNLFWKKKKNLNTCLKNHDSPPGSENMQ